MSRLRTLVLLFAATIAASAVGVGCGDEKAAGEASSGAPTPVTVLLDWYPNADHAGLVAAVERNYLERAGVKAKLVVPSDPTTALAQVAAGRADFAVSYESEVLIARSKGIPVVAIAAVISRPLNSIIARTDRGIRSPRDLEGKTVGAAGVPSDRALLDQIVRSDGGDPAKVRVRGIGYTLTPALAAGKVDAVIGAYWNIEAPELQAQGVKTRVFRLEKYGVPTHDELVLVASDTTVAERGELVRSVVKGFSVGQLWASGSSDLVALLLRRNPDLNRKVLPRQVALTAPLLSTTMAVVPAQWAVYADWMKKNGLLANDADVSKAVSDQFLP